MPTARPLEPPSELHLHVGKESRFRIGGAGSVGYQWTWTVGGDADAISVAIQPASGPPPIPPSGMLQSGSVDHVVVVRGLHAGVANLSLVLARPVASSHGPLASFTVVVTVK
jgi:hypothetical protein